MSLLASVKEVFLPVAAAAAAQEAGGEAAVLESQAQRAPSGDGEAAAPMRLPTRVRKPVPLAQEGTLYRAERSFVDHVPWVEVIDGDLVLLEDGHSVGAVWEVVPLGTEGRGADWLGTVRDMLQDVLQDSLEERDTDHWVLQTYTWRELDLTQAVTALREAIDPDVRETRFSREYVELVDRHYRGVARPGGLFDDELTGAPWSGARQRTLVALYRWSSPGDMAEEEDLGPEAELLEAGAKVMDALQGIGVRSRRLTGGEIHGWLARWFNGWTDLSPTNPAHFCREFLGEDQAPVGDDFASSLFYSCPRSDAANGLWWFDSTAVRALSVEGVRKAPAVGQVTGERRHGDVVNSMMDQLPEGTVYVSTVVPVPQDTVDEHIDRIAASSTGGGVEAVRTRQDCEEAKRIMGERHKLYRMAVTFFVRGSSLAEVNRRTNEARTVLLRHGFRAIAPRDDLRALDNFLLHLPMAYRPEVDRVRGWRATQLAWVQHIANLWPAFGRGVGTGRPGLSFFNRGGEPFTFDPMHRLDRQKNAHGLVVGPTGSGKSATLGAMLSQLLAVHRPRLFILEAGNSFGLLADWYESLGLTVNRVALRPGSGVSLAPFADLADVNEVAARLLEDTQTPVDEELGPIDEAPEGDDDEDEPRDVIGEKERIATLMITGGEAREIERLRRSERWVIRDALIEAGKNARAEGTQPRTEHVVRAFDVLGRTREELSDEERRRIREMRDSMKLYCDGFAGEIFNRAGEEWPEADVTVVDLGQFAREGYEAHLAIAVISLLNMVNNLAERDQHAGREIVVAIDEAHIVTTHPLVSPYLVKIVKMWRKLGAWLWLATQNLEDFPGQARKLLNMIEWWICLVLPKEEVEQMQRFRELGSAQKELLLSARKAHRKYTEGVVFADLVEGVFRCVPPSVVLALVQTERHEKAGRAKIMAEHGVTEVEAAVRIAAEIDAARGIAA